MRGGNLTFLVTLSLKKLLLFKIEKSKLMFVHFHIEKIEKLSYIQSYSFISTLVNSTYIKKLTNLHKSAHKNVRFHLRICLAKIWVKLYLIDLCKR